jgi:phosphatidylinositol alpha-1,6-mannosyltransferase
MLKVFLIQNIIAPYRVGLLQALARLPGIELLVVQLTRSEPHRREWENIRGEFKRKVLKGFRYSRSYDEHTIVNPGLATLLLFAKPQIVIISGFSPASLIAVLLKKFAKYKVILWFEGTQITDGNILGVRLRLRKYIAKGLDAAIVPGTLSKEYLRRLHDQLEERAIFTALNSIDSVEEQTSNVKPKACGENLAAAPSIICVARMIASKGIWELLQAFEATKQHIPSVRLLLAGTGPLDEAIRTYCKERSLRDVELLGFVSPAQLEQYYQEATVFVLLSHIDRNPLVVIEALRAGLPIIASYKIGNVPECVLHGVNGFVVNPDQPTEVAAHLTRLLSDTGMQRQFAAQSKRLSVQFSHRNAAEIFQHAIQYVNTL